MNLQDKVQRAIEKLRPLLQRDGGDVEIVEIKEKVVRIKLKGKCDGCPSSEYTLKMGIEELLKHEIPELERVEAVPD